MSALQIHDPVSASSPPKRIGMPGSHFPSPRTLAEQSAEAVAPNRAGIAGVWDFCGLLLCVHKNTAFRISSIVGMDTVRSISHDRP